MRDQRIGLGSRLWIASLGAITSVSIGLSAGAETEAEKIARSMRAAPPAVSQQATIIDFDGTVLRAGTNGWTCMPGLWPGDDHPMCNDTVWMGWMKALGSKTEPQTNRIGISYMLAGDARVNNADPFDTQEDPDELWVQEGPHLMILVPDSSILADVPDDPSAGGPYVMWKNTPYVHIMVPTAATPN